MKTFITSLQISSLGLRGKQKHLLVSADKAYENLGLFQKTWNTLFLFLFFPFFLFFY